MNVFKFDTSTEGIKNIVDDLQGAITGQVDLYFSGGSSAVVLHQLDKYLTNKDEIRLYQVDERYGPAGHVDSNWLFLRKIDNTLYKAEYSLLNGDDPQASPKQEARDYGLLVKASLSSPSKKIAILGIGPDSHIAGIKPMTAKDFKTIFSKKLVAAYDWTDFTRLTLTPEALQQFDALFVYAVGEGKREAIDLLEQSAKSDAVKPAIHDNPSSLLLSHANARVYYAQKEG